jgi:hypothetical protein
MAGWGWSLLQRWPALPLFWLTRDARSFMVPPMSTLPLKYELGETVFFFSGNKVCSGKIEMRKACDSAVDMPKFLCRYSVRLTNGSTLALDENEVFLAKEELVASL